MGYRQQLDPTKKDVKIQQVWQAIVTFLPMDAALMAKLKHRDQILMDATTRKNIWSLALILLMDAVQME